MDIILNSFVAFYYMYHLAIEEPAVKVKDSALESLEKLLESPTPHNLKALDEKSYNNYINYKRYEDNDDLPPKKFGDHDPFPQDPLSDEDGNSLNKVAHTKRSGSMINSRVRYDIEQRLGEALKSKFSSFRKKKARMESIFNDQNDKVLVFKLPADSAAMTYLACLKTEFSGLNLDVEQVSYVFENTVIINVLQMALVVFIWVYAWEQTEGFVQTPESFIIICARFIASMMMHLNTEKDLRNGISMMKYAVNHYTNFNNVHVAFLVAFLLTISTIAIEFTVVYVLTSLPNVLEVIMKYVSLAAIANIPRFYYGSLVDHKLLKVAGHPLTITNFRRNNPRKGAPYSIHFMRVLHKICRIYFCMWSYYFMPFTALFITYTVTEH